MNKHLLFVLVILLCGTHAMAYEVQPIPRARPLLGEIELVKAGPPMAAIATSDEPAHRQVALRLQKAIHKATGATLPIITDQVALSELGKQNLGVVGNLGTNRVSARLYRNYYVTGDALAPDAGRHELRTVHDPEGLGIGIVSCGGSDLAGITASTERLVDHLPTNPANNQDLALEHLVDVDEGGLPDPLSDAAITAELKKLKGPAAAASFIVTHGVDIITAAAM